MVEDVDVDGDVDDDDDEDDEAPRPEQGFGIFFPNLDMRHGRRRAGREPTAASHVPEWETAPRCHRREHPRTAEVSSDHTTVHAKEQSNLCRLARGTVDDGTHVLPLTPYV